MDRDLVISVQDQHPAAILSLSGFMAQLEVYKLRSLVDKAIEGGKRYFIVDLSRIAFIDSAGIGALAQLRGETGRRGGFLGLVEPRNQHVRQALLASSLNKIIDTFAELEQAVARLREQYGVGLPAARIEPVPVTRPVPVHDASGDVNTQLQRIEIRLARIERMLNLPAIQEPPAASGS